MQVTHRHVLTIDKQSVIRDVLNTLLSGVGPESSGPHGIRNQLEWFVRQGCDSLILNLRVVEEPLVGPPAKVRNVGTSLVAGVLVVACQVTTPLILQIEELIRQHLPARDLISSLRAFVHALF